jgi:hypothetical protein
MADDISHFQCCAATFLLLPGATRFALAPGYHISRLWRSGCVTQLSQMIDVAHPFSRQSHSVFETVRVLVVQVTDGF